MICFRKNMGRYGVHVVLGVTTLLACCLSLTQAADPDRLPFIEWPRQYADQGDTVIVFDPQIDSWERYETLSARSAVAVKPKGSSVPVYGVVEYKVNTEIDGERKDVLFKNRTITAIRFKELVPDQIAQAQEIVNRVVARGDIILPLAFVLAQIETDAQNVPAVAVSWDPPPIFASESPAIMIMILGEPEFKPIAGLDVEFCINTNWDLFVHRGTSQYFLLNGDGWLMTKNLREGPWSPAVTLPSAFSSLPANENWSEVKNHIPGKKISVPNVYYTERPAELIVLDGAAKYTEIPSTELVYVENTTSDLFRYTKDGVFYFLTSGRWFRAEKLEGPWTAATNSLPADFASIPPDGPKGSVLVSVPGTPEAKDAVLLAQVPHKAEVDPKSVSVEPTYDGDPDFVLIEGSKVYYAVNSPYSVFRVENRFYCCQDAVWFCAASSGGPWSVCTAVPPEIYAIPATSPMHNVTYVYVYDTTPDIVVVGYTAGYTGVYISSGVVVYGAAYPVYYAPYYYYHYYPAYYGYGCAMHYSYAYGTYYRSSHVYGPYGGAGYGTAYNPHTGTYARGAYAYGPYGSRYAAQSYNPYTSTYKARSGGSTPYASWERGVVSKGGEWARGGYYSDARGTAAGIQTSRGGAAVGVKTDDGSAAVARSKTGDVYAAKDGSVYKKNEDGSWSETGRPAPTAAQGGGAAATAGSRETSGSNAAPEKSSGTAAQKPAPQPSTGAQPTDRGAAAGQVPATSSSTKSELDRQSQNRSRGWQSTQRSDAGGGRSGGGWSGGGRRR